MLNISFKCTENTITDIDTYFNFNYEDEWFADDVVKKMIFDVDKSKVIDVNCIESPVLGQITPILLSGGVKALILMYKEPQLEIWATACGDNCANWILEIAKRKDITIVLEHIMNFEKDFKGFCLNNNKPIDTLNEYRKYAIEQI